MGRGRATFSLLEGRERLRINMPPSPPPPPPLQGLLTMPELLRLPRIKAFGQTTNTIAAFLVDLADLGRTEWVSIALPENALSRSPVIQLAYTVSPKSGGREMRVVVKAGHLSQSRHEDPQAVWVKGSWKSWSTALLECYAVS